jgi:acetyl esterase/lipase
VRPRHKLATLHIPYGPLRGRRLDVYLPKNGEVRASILYLYGGRGLAARAGIIACSGGMARGYAVAVPDYHLYPHAKFPAFVEDGALASSGCTTPQPRSAEAPRGFFIAMGHSAGAYLGAARARCQIFACPRLDPSAIKGVIGLAGPIRSTRSNGT